MEKIDKSTKSNASHSSKGKGEIVDKLLTEAGNESHNPEASTMIAQGTDQEKIIPDVNSLTITDAQIALFQQEKEAGMTDATTIHEWLQINLTPAHVLSQVDSAINAIESQPSKLMLATNIFKEELENARRTQKPMSRKYILTRFKKEAGLTDSGANTYYQNFRDKFGLVQHQQMRPFRETDTPSTTAA